MNDDFYSLKNENTTNVIDLLTYTRTNTQNIWIEMRKSKNHRESSDKTLDEVLELITNKPPNFVRIIYRKQMNFFPLLSDKLYIDDAVEIGIRGIYHKDIEYFIFAYLDKEKMPEILKRYELKKIS